jgi:hypothetical protein
MIIRVLEPDGQDISIDECISVTSPNYVEVDEGENFLMTNEGGASFESTTSNNTTESYFDTVEIKEEMWLDLQ